MAEEQKNITNKESVKDYKPNTYLSWLQEMLKIIDQYGCFKILKALLLFSVSSYFIYLTFNPEVVIDKYIDYRTQRHDDAVTYRLENEPQIRMDLKELLIETDADRSFIIEFHNGTNNISGLPFMYGNMSYEEVNKGISHVDEDYSNFSLQKFAFINKLLKEGSWYGHVSDLEEIDKRLSLRLASNNVNEIGLVVMYGCEKEIGIVGISFVNRCGEHNEAKMTRIIRKYCQKISPLLNAERLK